MTLEGFNFSLVNNGNVETDYTIYLDDIPLDVGETSLPDWSKDETLLNQLLNL